MKPILSLSFLASIATGQIGDIYVNPANGNSYALTTNRLGWEEAQVLAESLGANLVTIRSMDENQWLFETFMPIEPDGESIWIGLTDRDNEGEWVWVSGEPAGYRNWYGSEPNNGPVSPEGEDFACIYRISSFGRWNDYSSPWRWQPGGPFDPELAFPFHQRAIIEWVELCEADLNSDGILDVFDVILFVGYLSLGDGSADWNGDTIIDIFDVFAYLAEFEGGC